MGVDLTGSELDNKKGLVVWYPILLIIACAHWSQGLREVEGEENRLKRRWEDQLCAPCSVPESVGSDQIASPPFLPDSMRIFLYRLGYRRAILLVPRLFSMIVVIYANCSFPCVRERR